MDDLIAETEDARCLSVFMKHACQIGPDIIIDKDGFSVGSGAINLRLCRTAFERFNMNEGIKVHCDAHDVQKSLRHFDSEEGSSCSFRIRVSDTTMKMTCIGEHSSATFTFPIFRIEKGDRQGTEGPSEERVRIMHKQIDSLERQMLTMQSELIGNNSEIEKLKEKQADCTKCIICQIEPRDTLFRPCNHFILCQKCQIRVHDCPLCRKMIVERLKVFT